MEKTEISLNRTTGLNEWLGGREDTEGLLRQEFFSLFIVMTSSDSNTTTTTFLENAVKIIFDKKLTTKLDKVALRNAAYV